MLSRRWTCLVVRKPVPEDPLGIIPSKASLSTSSSEMTLSAAGLTIGRFSVLASRRRLTGTSAT
jgi:hypothetical protein